MNVNLVAFRGYLWGKKPGTDKQTLEGEGTGKDFTPDAGKAELHAWLPDREAHLSADAGGTARSQIWADPVYFLCAREHVTGSEGWLHHPGSVDAHIGVQRNQGSSGS